MSYPHMAMHRVIAERALKRPLKGGEEVHHIDGNGFNNDPSNLVVCSRAYHKLLHMRQEAFEACGNYNYKKCGHCKQWDNPANMRGIKGRATVYHMACSRAAYNKLYAAGRINK